MEKFLYPQHPVRCIITATSVCRNSVFLTISFLFIFNEFEKIYIYSPSLHQDLYQKLINCFSIVIPINIIPNFFNEEGIDVVNDETVNDKDFQKPDAEVETYESKLKLKFLQEYEDWVNIISDDLYAKEMTDPRVQAMFKGFRHNNLSFFIINQDYYEKPRRMIRSNGNIYQIFKPNNFRDGQNLYQDKASMDMTFNKFNYLYFACWNKKYQPSAIDMTKDKNTGRYRLRLNSLFVPYSYPF